MALLRTNVDSLKSRKVVIFEIDSGELPVNRGRDHFDFRQHQKTAADTLSGEQAWITRTLCIAPTYMNCALSSAARQVLYIRWNASIALDTRMSPAGRPRGLLSSV